MRSGFTLLEIMVGTAIGVMLLTLMTASFLGVRRLAERNRTLVSLHEAAAGMHRTVEVNLLATAHSAKWECAADPGAGGWGTGDEVLTLTWMCTLSDPKQLTYGFGRDLKGDMLWCRLRWIGGGLDATGRLLRGRLQFARSSGNRAVKYATWNQVSTNPLYRRDRRRDLDDNDLRFIPGLTNARYLGLAMPGDSQDLDLNLLDLHSPMITVTDPTFSWIDAGGRRVEVSAKNGIREFDRLDNPISLSGTDWDSQTRYGVDGMFLDGRAHEVEPRPGDRRDIADTRPMLVRLSCVISDYRGSADERTTLSMPVDLAFPTGNELPAP